MDRFLGLLIFLLQILEAVVLTFCAILFVLLVAFVISQAVAAWA